MKIQIEIPDCFITDFHDNNFTDFFNRVISDIKDEISHDRMCGNYELETAEMFVEAFENAKEVENEKDIKEIIKNCYRNLDYIESTLEWYDEELGLAFANTDYDDAICQLRKTLEFMSK